MMLRNAEEAGVQIRIELSRWVAIRTCLTFASTRPVAFEEFGLGILVPARRSLGNSNYMLTDFWGYRDHQSGGYSLAC